MDSKYKILSCISAGAFIYYASKYLFNYFTTANNNNNNCNCNNNNNNSSNSNSDSKEYKLTEEEILREELKRNYEFFGEEGMKRIRNSFVIVIGLDGIGSNVALTLIRSGINKIRLIDNSILTYKTYQYHPCAVMSDIFQLNSDIITKYAKQINPYVNIEIINSLSQIDMNFNDNPSYIIDCLNKENDIPMKCDIIKQTHTLKLNLITNLYINNKDNQIKFDPTMIRQEQFQMVKSDSTAKAMKHIYKCKYNEAVPNINTVYSIEETKHNNNNNNNTTTNNISIQAVIAQVISSKVLCDIAQINK